MSDRIDWAKLWAEFDEWVGDQEDDPDWWNDQQPKIQELVERELARDKGTAA